MNENKNVSDPKENTIDILVRPKKNAPAKEPPSQPRKEVRTPVRSTSDQTRFVPPVTKVPTKNTSKLAQQTRVGKPIPMTVAKNTARTVKGAVTSFRDKYANRMQKDLSEEEKKELKDSFRPTIFLALIYIAVVVVISAVLSVFAIRWGNDIFALVKEEVVATVTIPENATISEVADILEEHGLIEYSSVFRTYVGFKNRDADPPLAFRAGDYEIRSTLNYDQIVSMIKDRKRRQIVTITIPEGYTVDEIIELFVSQNIGTREGFLYAVNEYPYQYRFMDALNQIKLSSDRRYRLEGYLFPNTYEFYTDSSEVAIVDKMLTAFEIHFEEVYYARLDELKMNLDQVVTLASIVQKEGKFSADFYPISGVFHNRLKSTTLKRLQSDATVQYVLKDRKEDLTYADLDLKDPYNTYQIEGLPPSAIANPGWEAIQAALYPEKNSHYYFVSDTDGSTIFADNETQHLKNVAALRAAKENGTTID